MAGSTTAVKPVATDPSEEIDAYLREMEVLRLEIQMLREKTRNSAQEANAILMSIEAVLKQWK